MLQDLRRPALARWHSSTRWRTFVASGFGNPETSKIMSRRFIDCREYPGEMKCTIALSADTDEELLAAAVQHAVTVHGMEDTPELRTELRSMFKNGTPPVATPPPAATA